MWMKKRYVLNFDGQQHNAVIASQGDQTQIQIGDDGQMEAVGHHPVLGGRAISIRVRGKLHLVHLSGLDSKGALAATIDGRPVSLTVMDELRAQALEAQSDSGGSGSICADIPGLVLELKVETDQHVQAGDPVIVVEAMKMQNELTAAISGRVSVIRVKPGQSVNPGDVLVIIDPDLDGSD